MKKNPVQKKTSGLLRILKFTLLSIVMGVIGIVVLVFFLVQVPYVQNQIKNKVVGNLSTKLKTKFSVQKLSVDFRGVISLQGVFLADRQSDTLLSAGKIGVTFQPSALFHKQLIVNSVSLEDIYLKYLLEDSAGRSNIDFIVKAFADTLPSAKKTESSWKLAVNTISLTNINLNYSNQSDSMDMKFHIGKSAIDLHETDVLRKKFVVQSFILSNSEARLTSYALSNKSVQQTQSADTLSNKPASQAMITVLKKIRLNNISFIQTEKYSGASGIYKVDSALILPEIIDMEKRRLVISRLMVSAAEISVLTGKQTQEEKKQQGVAATKNNKGWDISLRNGKVTMAHFDLASVISMDGENHKKSILSLSSFALDANNNAYATDVWKSNIASLQFVDNNTGLKTLLSLNTSFKDGNIVAQGVNIKSGSSFLKADAAANISHTGKGKIPDFNLRIVSSSINRDDINDYLSKIPVLQRYRFPAHLVFSCNLSSENQTLKGKGAMNSELGGVRFNAQLVNAQPVSSSAYMLTLNTDSLDLGKLLKNPSLGPVTAKIEVEGSGTDPYTLNATAVVNMDAVSANNKSYHNITLNANLSEGDVLLNASSGMPEADFQLAAAGHISKGPSHLYLKTNIQNIDLHALGITRDTLSFSGYLASYYDGQDLKHFKVKADSFLVRIALPGEEINLQNKLAYTVSGDSVNASFNSDPLRLDYSGTMMFKELPAAIGKFLGKYDMISQKELQRDSGFFNLKVDVKDLSTVESLLPVSLRIPESGNLTAGYKDGKLTATADFRYMELGENEFDGVKLRVDGRDTTLYMSFSIGSVNTAFQLIRDVNISGRYNGGLFDSRLKFSDEKGDPWFNIAMGGDLKTRERKFILRDTVLLNYLTWNIPSGNQIFLGDNGLTFKKVSISHRDKLIALTDNTANPESMGLEFKNLNLSAVAALLKGDSAAFSGFLNGKVTVSHLMDKDKKQPLVFDADLAVKKIMVSGAAVGDLLFTGSNKTDAEVANINMNLGNDSMMIFKLTGDYGLKPEKPMHFNLTTKDFNISTLAPFTENVMTNPRGFVNASVDISGSTSKPVFSGNIGFKDVYMFVNGARTAFQVNDQQILFSDNRINFPSFTINDATGNPLEIKGDIIVNDFKNFRYRLNMNMDNFLAYKADAINQPDKFTKAIISGDISIEGKNAFPVVNATLNMNEGSSLYYKMTRHNTNVSARGVVEFIGTADTVQTQQVSLSLMQNMDVTANISLDDGTPITIITDPARNMGLDLTAGGTLSFRQLPLQSPSLSGKINISGGSYTLNISGLKRTFALSDSSTIAWYGNIANPDMNLKAYYTVNTPALGLMPVADNEGRYSTAIPFRVNMIIRGELAQPTFNFQLSLPQEYESTYGDVVAQLQVVNSDENEVNQKAISLLLFGSFDFSNYANIINNGSGGTNALISRTMNQFASQMIHFVDLHFDLQSFDNYGGTTGENLRTQMKVSALKKFYNNRLTTQAGGTFVLQGDEREQNKSFTDKIVPEYKVEYALDKQKIWKVKSFRQSEYRGLVEGKVVSLGAGLVFEKDYERLRDLFRRKAVKKKTSPQATNLIK